MSRASYGKPLKGISSISAQLTAQIADSLISSLSSGAIALTNVNITGGTIDGVVLGTNESNIGQFTTITSGNPGGQGYSVCFFGLVVGDSACWKPATGTWNIQGKLLVRDSSNLGNIQIQGNTISATNSTGAINLQSNTNGNINLTTLGTGDLVLSSASDYQLSANNITNLSKLDTILNTNNGNITLQTGLIRIPYNISSIGTGSSPQITTTLVNNLKPGDVIDISGSNSIPNIDGTYTVITTPSTTSFTINTSVPVTNMGTNAGTILQHNDINLTASNNVNIPTNVNLNFGSNCNSITGTSTDLNINSCANINLNPTLNVNIPTNVKIAFGSRYLMSNGTDLLLNTGSNNFVITGNKTTINGDLIVNGDTTYISSTSVDIKDPVFTLGGDLSNPLIIDDGKDRGIQYLRGNGTAAKMGFFGFSHATGCFTYIPDAVNTSEVFTGTPGCVNFGSITGTSLNLQGGTINNINTLNTCNITCSGTMTLTASNGITLNSPSTTNSGNLTVTGDYISNGSNFTVNSTNPIFTNPLIYIGGNSILTSNNTNSIGTLFNYYNGSSSQTNFFGYNNSNNSFTYLTNTTVIGNVVTGTLGNVTFGTGTFNTVATNIANISTANISTLNTCNINCSGTMSITAANGINMNTGSITNSNLNVSSPIVIIGGTSVSPPTSYTNVDYGIQYQYYDTGAENGWFGVKNNTFKFIPVSTNTNNVITGALGNAQFNDLTVNNLTVSGNIVLPATVSTVMTTEHISGSVSPDPAINVSFINITSSGIFTGTLNNGTIDGFVKHIIISYMATGGQYKLFSSNNFIDAGSGTNNQKTLVFTNAGQSVNFIWDNNNSTWILVNGGACII